MRGLNGAKEDPDIEARYYWCYNYGNEVLLLLGVWMVVSYENPFEISWTPNLRYQGESINKA